MHEKVVKDNFRIIKAIEYLVDLRKISKSVTFLSHLGRPDGINLDYSLKPVAEEMSLLLNEEVLFINSLHGPEVKNHIDENPGKVFLLENLRFHNEETAVSYTHLRAHET